MLRGVALPDVRPLVLCLALVALAQWRAYGPGAAQTARLRPALWVAIAMAPDGLHQSLLK